DKGRIRWTFFGSSEQGPARAFWRSFFTAPGREEPEEQSLEFFRRLLGLVYGRSAEDVADLRAAGFRILPCDADKSSSDRKEGPRRAGPSGYFWQEGQGLDGVKYLLTFRPLAELPPALRKAYLGGELTLLPFPGSLLFWSAPPYLHLQTELPFAMQVP